MRVREVLGLVSRWISGRLTSAADFLFGYDFFISYAHKDGTQYPRLLHDRLEALGYRTFLDVQGYTGGDDLRTGTRRRIGMSKKLLLLARPHALSESRWVQLELQHFIELDRSPIVIEFPAATGMVPDGSPLAELLRDRRSIREEIAGYDGSPSDAVIQELVRSFTATRQETLRLRALGATVVLFSVIAVVAIWQWYAAVQERRIADAQRGDALATSKYVGASRLMAEWDLEAARALGIQADERRLREEAPTESDSASLRLKNLQNELAETRSTMSNLAKAAADTRRAGHGELARANAAWAQVSRNPDLIRQIPPVPKIFSFEIMSVGRGENLILHYGDPDAPQFILIDGGQGSNYPKTLKPRLEALRERWARNGKLPIEYVMVSNHDDDRIGGFDRMFRELLELREKGAEAPFDIRNVWFESFVPPYTERWVKAATRQRIDQLGIAVNKPFDHLVMRRDSGHVAINLGDCLIATILGPDSKALAALHEMWAERATDRDLAPPAFPLEQFRAIPSISECRGIRSSDPRAETTQVAVNEKPVTCRDRSVVNRASLIILFEYQGRRFLHPGDSCSDQIEAGLQAAGLGEPDGSFLVDVLLVPHLGSANNVNLDFFRRVKARQYLFTSSGTFGLPREEVLQMILDARRDDAGRRDKYVMLFLNRDGTQELGKRLDAFFASRSSEEFGYRQIFRSSSENAIIIDLLDRVRY